MNQLLFQELVYNLDMHVPEFETLDPPDLKKSVGSQKDLSQTCDPQQTP